MDVDLILREASSVSKYWRLEGFCTDTSRTILLTPLGPSACIALPPYHLLCVLNEQDPCYQDLVDVSDNPGSKLPESRIRFIAKTVVELLDAWAVFRNFRGTINKIAMGSRIHIDEIMTSTLSKIWISPNLELEKRYISPGRLRQLWVDLALDLPQTLDFENMAAISRLHDSTSMVQLANGEVAVFKGAVRIVARMYHELRELIRMPDHANVLSKPKYVVTRQISGRLDGVACGFIVGYHSGASLLNGLASSTPQQPIPMDTKIKWIQQLISALQHIYGPAVLSQEGDVVLVDFEQYGSPQRWLHPSLWDKPAGHHVLPNQGWRESPINPVSMLRSTFYSNPTLGLLQGV
ncbi:unnamed protein product [Clonostachys rosea f. rosea IK726]|uniref:Uncharacterized protein n=1 Tax=Clonostachys rosea f. rosea IK726 TaxID=1349383 RepID=A0ACA9TAQ3_BIOOC|nr:unnamed protein product [Clonostachys rosea f. rosea IK726]